MCPAGIGPWPLAYTLSYRILHFTYWHTLSRIGFSIPNPPLLKPPFSLHSYPIFSPQSLLSSPPFCSAFMAGGDKAPNSKPSPIVQPKDDAYLAAVIPKRIAQFESIKAQQALDRLSLSGDLIKFRPPSSSLSRSFSLSSDDF